MKFAHIADCHLGCWRNPTMQELSLRAFEKAIDRCIKEKVDFVIIAGDLFDTAIPSIDVLKVAANKLRELKEKNIKCFLIPGSHDFSATGKTMISVLENAGLCINVDRNFFEFNDIVLYGVAGKKGSLEQREIIELKKELNDLVKGKKAILLLHTTITEALDERLKEKMPSISLDELPDNFIYYALGHLHDPCVIEKNNKLVVYPGALFPSNFLELEKQHNLRFFIVEIKNGKIHKADIKEVREEIARILNITVRADDETPISVKEKIEKEIEKIAKNEKSLKNSVLTLRVEGKLKSGKPSEIRFDEIENKIKELGALTFLKNTAKLETREFELKIKAEELESIEKLEELSLDEAIKEGIIKKEDKELVETLLKHLDLEKQEGETTASFTERIAKDLSKALHLDI